MPNKKVYLQIRLNLKAIRINAGFSQAKVAKKLGVSQNAYSKQELGYSRIDVEMLIDLAAIFEFEFTEFMAMLIGEPIEPLRLKVLHK